MKIKILGQFNYQTFPETEDMIEISADDLQAVKQRAKCFNVERNGITNYTKPVPTADEIEIEYKKQVVSGIRTKYSVEDEIAILRQKGEKPLEYQAYFDFCEQCKAEARGGVAM